MRDHTPTSAPRACDRAGMRAATDTYRADIDRFLASKDMAPAARTIPKIVAEVRRAIDLFDQIGVNRTEILDRIEETIEQTAEWGPQQVQDDCSGPHSYTEATIRTWKLDGVTCTRDDALLLLGESLVSGIEAVRAAQIDKERAL